MIKILHSADWHLDSPLQGRTDAQTRLLRQSLLALPGKVAAICREEGCDLMLLSGDLFDGAYTKDSYLALFHALESVEVPVFITPGNHDFSTADSPWLAEQWPKNVHIFIHPVIESVSLPTLNCRVYGAGFVGMDCPGLLEGFRVEQPETWAIGILHGDPTQTNSPYCPITSQQIRASGLDYLALGHIHKGGMIQEGKTLCAWPGCPMGRGYDESGDKGLLIVTVDEKTTIKFVPLDTPKFYDLECPIKDTAEAALENLLPPVGNSDFYRITFTGNSPAIDIATLTERFSRFPNLELRDKTQPPVDIWKAVGEDSFEGMYFRLLQDALQGQDEESQRIVQLAARISRQILDGQEVVLP